ncbi:hypothetical protein HQ520_07055 [bacterium]|nr:hypothetical protein [bacterium]
MWLNQCDTPVDSYISDSRVGEPSGADTVFCEFHFAIANSSWEKKLLIDLYDWWSFGQFITSS